MRGCLLAALTVGGGTMPAIVCQDVGASAAKQQSPEEIAKSVAEFEALVVRAERLGPAGDNAATRKACEEALAAANLKDASRRIGALPNLYFLNRSSKTRTSGSGYRTGSALGP